MALSTNTDNTSSHAEKGADLPIYNPALGGGGRQQMLMKEKTSTPIVKLDETSRQSSDEAPHTGGFESTLATRPIK